MFLYKFNSNKLRYLGLALSVFFMSSHAIADSDTDQKIETDTNTMSVFGGATEISVGVGMGTVQRYMGSSSDRFILWPVISVHRGLFFADTLRGLGAEWQSKSGFYIADAINYDVGRGVQTNVFRPGSTNLTAMGDVAQTLTNTVTIAQGLATWFSINAQAETALNGSQRGNQYQLGVESTFSSSPNDTFTFDLDGKFGDGRYNQTYFGVTSTQSQKSGFASFTPGSGVYAYALTGTWKHTMDKNWSTQLIVTGTSYTNRVSASPILDRRSGLTTFMSVNYSF